MLEEFCRQPFVNRVLFRELERDAHHHQAEHAHPAGGVALLERRAAGKPLAAIEHRDVVEPEEAAFEDVVALTVDFVHPPREVEHQLVKALLEEVSVGGAVADPIHVVDAPHRPRVHRRIEIRELPFVRRNLPVRMLELLEQHQPELVLREMRIDQSEDDGLEREIPGREPRILPFVRHRKDPHRVEMTPMPIASELTIVRRR